jgi:hypothetical protein
VLRRHSFHPERIASRPLWLLGATLALGLAACAPARQGPPVRPEFTFNPQSETVTAALSQAFKSPLYDARIRLGKGKSFKYEGTDQRAFLAMIDRFYLEHPGFCPVENAFLFDQEHQVYLSLAAHPGTGIGAASPEAREVRVLVYDQSQQPQLTFAFFEGLSTNPITASPCRTSR